jgi:hypothetical protein
MLSRLALALTLTVRPWNSVCHTCMHTYYTIYIYIVYMSAHTSQKLIYHTQSVCHSNKLLLWQAAGQHQCVFMAWTSVTSECITVVLVRSVSMRVTIMMCVLKYMPWFSVALLESESAGYRSPPNKDLYDNKLLRHFRHVHTSEGRA